METVACKVCDELTVFTDEQLCLNCLEVQGRLEVYLRSKVGRQWVRAALVEAYDVYDTPKPFRDHSDEDQLKWLCEEVSAQKDLRTLDGNIIKRLEARLAEYAAQEEHLEGGND